MIAGTYRPAEPDERQHQMHFLTPRRTTATLAGTAIFTVVLFGSISPAYAAARHGGDNRSYGTPQKQHRHGTNLTLPSCDSSTPADCGELFDDFSYTSNSDPEITSHGWYLRTDQGGPGQSGATWTPDNIAFTTVDGQGVLQLTTKTNGTAAGTSQAELGRTADDAFAGTYLARIKFADTPVSGTDGDHVVETFYAISSPPDCDPSYSETDFSEYLPNGGYGETRTFNSQSTWAIAGADECDSDFVESDQYTSLDGWHTVMATISNDTVTYYVDGEVVGTASGNYYPRINMSIAFNLWTLDLTGHTGTATSTYKESVDYVYYAENRALTPAQAAAQVASYRNDGTTFSNTVGNAP